jgi:hypothetical protein
VAGDVPLAYYGREPASGQPAWLPLTTAPWSPPELAPGEEWSARLAVRRIDMTPGPGAVYQSLLEVTDGVGSRLQIPVRAYALQHLPAPAGAIELFGEDPNVHPYTGLWVGNALIDQVSQPSHRSDPLTPIPTGSGFPFRLIIHVGTNGQSRLLRQVLLAWQEATYTNNAQGTPVLDQPRRVCWLTDDRWLGQCGFTRPPQGRRISSAAFGHANPLLMTVVGSFGVTNATASCQSVLGYDAPLNPFKHRYHPDHDNLDARFEAVLSNRVESYEVTRAISLRFGATNQVTVPLAGWGDGYVGGDYREVITGLHRQVLHLRGTFLLQRVSLVGVLDAPAP